MFGQPHGGVNQRDCTLAQVSRRPTVRLNTNLSGPESGSAQK
jgi:hypothetical protein